MPPPAVHELRAGLLMCQYTKGSVRHIRLGNCEILQHVYFALRGQRWETIPLLIKREEIRARDLSFEIELEVEHKEGELAFFWRGRITGTEDGRISYATTGEAQSDFLRNRIGLCVLHPAQSCRGLECMLLHADGSTEISRFPDLISPHQPFFNLRGITYRPIPGITAETLFGGDVFETEDQRNWSDASFKTYSTPLSIQYPAQVRRGDEVSQQVELRVTAESPMQSAAAHSPVSIAVDTEAASPMPWLGVVWEPQIPIGGFDFFRLELDLRKPGWQDDLAQAAAIGVRLEIAALATSKADLENLRSVVEPFLAKVIRFAVFDPVTNVSDPALLAVTRSLLAPLPVGGGSHKYFAELNRNREIALGGDFVVWPVDPQVHADDAETAIENLAGQTPQLETARSFCGNRGLHISPVAVPKFDGNEGWCTICLKNLALAGARSLTFARALPLIEEVARFRADQVVACTSSDPLAADALILRKGRKSFAWVVNLRNRAQNVELANRSFSLDSYGIVRVQL